MALFDTILSFFNSEQQAAREEKPDPLVLRAILLIETASYDSEFADEERNTIVNMLSRAHDLSTEQVEELMTRAAKRREGVADVYQFTRDLAADMDMAARKNLMADIWRVIFADGQVDEHEEHFARLMQKMLRLDHPTWIAAKLEAKEA